MIFGCLVIDGQGVTLSTDGGAAKYIAQVNYQLSSPRFRSSLAHLEVHPLNFPQPTGKGVGRGLLDGEVTRRIVDSTKALARYIVPGGIYSNFADAWNRGHRRVGHRDSGPLRSPVLPAGETNTLVHQLTNYVVPPYMGRWTMRPNVRVCVTFLDIQDLYLPECFDDAEATRRQMCYSFYRHHADYFFAISEFTKATLVERLGLDPTRIMVTPLAADDMDASSALPVDRDWARSFGRFLIYPAKLWPHKNHEFLLRTLSELKDVLRNKHVKLILTGGFSTHETKRLAALLARYRISDHVEVLGFVSANRLRALVQEAEFLIFPSLYEGFGMPVLEAMHLGCPVISSNAGSLLEVGGDAALYFNPRASGELAGILRAAVDGQIDRQSLMDRGKQNSRRYSWEKTFQLTLDGYAEMARIAADR